jgi:hypothetical protein
MLYGAHVNHTLLEPDEIELLHALARAASVSHQQVRIATLQREVAVLSNENVAQQKVIGQFDASLRALVQERGVGEGGRPA